ncbi:hypothetical protein [Sphingobacterium sp. BIGb0165]|uniref:hypothetical protein n=1 Tax=Sphingobacterium sp. BIGb0165 TaxID=2940615 RepID=UPI0021693D6D|nr:hypothetical protein [Sphingobacterium sp. BIGb0165]MCS4226542.1 hypothetical protein [Sphingobacterium sp. BIGb0165]
MTFTMGGIFNLIIEYWTETEGGSPTRVTSLDTIVSFNNLLVRTGKLDNPDILVAGGVSYVDFEKFVRLVRGDKSLKLSMYAADPVGKRIDPGQRYQNNEKFYLCLDNQDPFRALESYATVLKRVQDIQLSYYDFPTECLWYASYFNNDKSRAKFNNTKGAVEEMDNAIRSGITKYTKVAIRLVPDAYGQNNQQGWWDDLHWGKYNEPMSTELPHYTAPFLTTASWAKEIIKKGGYPFTYMQSARRSEDFVKLHPNWMMFNDPYRKYYGNQSLELLKESTYFNEFGNGYTKQWWQDEDRQLWGYDFTDHGFIEHMKEVYSNLKEAGIKGVFYDYPENTAWAYEGGFEDKYATTAFAYRNMFKIAYEGLGKGTFLQERNIVRGSDIALGAIASQRVWADTDGITPKMISYCGLRWYKNRQVINYDMDSKDPSDALPVGHSDGNRAMLTMSYVTSGRFLLGRSFSQLTATQLHDLSRTFPYHNTTQSARPLDAFNGTSTYPRVYDFAINSNWHQLTLYNDHLTQENTIEVFPSKSLNEGGMQLDKKGQFYLYDFWNDKFLGLVDHSTKIVQSLRPGEARMIAVHRKEDHPQFISTNRHIMQGYIDLRDVLWNNKGQQLLGTSSVVQDDPYELVIACNGKKPKKIVISSGSGKILPLDEKNGIYKLHIMSNENAEIKWRISF